MQTTMSLEKCANEKCSAVFTSLGEGKFFVFSISEPTIWSLPKGMRQKALWLCDVCHKMFSLQVNQNTGEAEIVPLPRSKTA